MAKFRKLCAKVEKQSQYFYKTKEEIAFLLQYATIVFFIFRAIYTVVFVDIMHEHKTNFDSSERQYIVKVETIFTSWYSPLILQAGCMSLGIIVTLLACIAHKFVSSKRLTKYASNASCRHTTASMVNLMPKFISLAISHTKL